MKDIHQIRLRVNGREHELAVEARRTLADMLRHDLGYTGTHLGCEHGICGACTVLMDGSPVRACLVFGVQADGTQVSTVEGLSAGDELSDLQQAFSDHHALQCGFCTPGFLMLAEAYLAERHLPPPRHPPADPNAWAEPKARGPGGGSQDESATRVRGGPADVAPASGSLDGGESLAEGGPAGSGPGGGTPGSGPEGGSRGNAEPFAGGGPEDDGPGGGSNDASEPPDRGGPADDEVSEAEVRKLIAANLCRCTGYQGIVEAVLATARSRRAARPRVVQLAPEDGTGGIPADTGQANAGQAGKGPAGTGPAGTRPTGTGPVGTGPAGTGPPGAGPTSPASGSGAVEPGHAADTGAAGTSVTDTSVTDTGTAGTRAAGSP